VQDKETSIRIRNLLISLAVFAALLVYAATYAETVLRVSLMPDESASLLRRKSKPLLDYLEQKIGMKVEFRPMRDGDALVEALLANKLDMVWIDGPGLDLARQRSDGRVVALVRCEEEKSLSPVSNTMPSHADYTWAVRSDMDAKLRQKLTDAFLALDRRSGEDRAILDLQRVGKFVPAGN
jgi:ABC-type phosphate/phosphonate transport system substrate-binding protein